MKTDSTKPRATVPTTFGEVRQFILETMAAVRNGECEIGSAMAVAGLMKELNSNIQAEINAAKVSIQTQGAAHNFGEVMIMGRRMISENAVNVD